MKLRLTLATVALTLILVTGCMRTYRIDIQQGNAIDKAQLDQLQPGMNKAEVRFILGSPLVADPFHVDRWDYFFSFKSGETLETEQRHLALIFEDDRLVEIQRSDSGPQPDDTSQADPESEEPGFLTRTWQKIWKPKEDKPD
ncbi:MAG: outer membrane protein assembly factor BamE [Pseudomonadota bacterium]|nr:outer membrane protein assembly factor BamE [Pseudomonadota bacterium]MED5406204.1 outer membrane protein assembly factor BamE [Pseudomonadota bacterium]MEE3288689.1 outer membrane protein assembly factor BamE [Pseudomonadota bacterium]